MRISLSTGTFYHRALGFSLALARDTGCDGVELVLGLGSTLGWPAHLERFERAVAQAGVPVLSVHPPLRPLPGWPRGMGERVGRVVATAQRLGAPVVVLHPALYSRAESPRAARYAAAIGAGQRLAGNAVTIAIENNQTVEHARRWVLDPLPALVEFAREHACGITLDTCHVGANGEDLLASYELVRPLLRNIHLSDMRWEAGRARTHLLPGEGILPLDRFLNRLASDGYDGLVTLELHPHAVGLIGRAGAQARLLQALRYVRAAIAPTTQPSTESAEITPSV
jgi:sugar phosphate isomerase/epimerase